MFDIRKGKKSLQVILFIPFFLLGGVLCVRN